MRCTALLVLMLAACSASDKELAALKSAHSIVAEWAEVARLKAAGQVGETYAREMTDEARTELVSARQELRDPNDPAARLIDGLGGAAPDAARLAGAARSLGRMEQVRAAR
jgi:hypothetical protein